MRKYTIFVVSFFVVAVVALLIWGGYGAAQLDFNIRVDRNPRRWASNAGFPSVITSMDELVAYADVDFSAFDIYTEEFFEDRLLLIFSLVAPDTSVSYRVDAVLENGDIHVTRLSGGMGIHVIRTIRFILEVDNTIIPEEFNIIFNG